MSAAMASHTGLTGTEDGGQMPPRLACGTLRELFSAIRARRLGYSSSANSCLKSR